MYSFPRFLRFIGPNSKPSRRTIFQYYFSTSSLSQLALNSFPEIQFSEVRTEQENIMLIADWILFVLNCMYIVYVLPIVPYSVDWIHVFDRFAFSFSSNSILFKRVRFSNFSFKFYVFWQYSFWKIPYCKNIK